MSIEDIEVLVQELIDHIEGVKVLEKTTQEMQEEIIGQIGILLDEGQDEISRLEDEIDALKDEIEDLDDFKTEKVKEIEQFLDYDDVQNSGITAKSLLESIVKDYYDNL